MAEIIRPPEFNRPNLRLLLARAETLFAELKITPPAIDDSMSTNRFAIGEENQSRVAELLEHHLIQFKSAVEAQPEKLEEIIKGSSMLWLCLERAKKLSE